MKQVITAPNAAEAHVALAALESAGIDAVIQGEYGTLELGPITRPTVWVRDEDYEEACKTLGVAVSQSPTPGSSKGPSLRTMILILIVLLAILWLQR